MGSVSRIADLPLRVVIDTNVLVSSLALRSRALSQLPQYWHERMLIPLASAFTLNELATTLSAPKFGLNVSQVRTLLADYVPWCEILSVSNPPIVPKCRDANDRPFLELAAFASADALITGDSDLLDLQPLFEIPVITPKSLFALMDTTA